MTEHFEWPESVNDNITERGNGTRLACPDCGSDELATLEVATCVAECDGIYSDGPAFSGTTAYERGEQKTIGVICDSCDRMDDAPGWLSRLVPYVEEDDE